MDQSLKPLGQVLKAPLLPKPPDLLRFYVAVGDLDPNGIQIMVMAVKITVTQCLGQMDRVRLLQPVYIHINTFNFIDHSAGRFRNDPIRPSLHQDLEHILPDPVL